MMFLTRATRRTRGLAKLRALAILAMRVLALLALILAVGRPLSTSRLGGLASGGPDSTLVVLDRSVSMEANEAKRSDVWILSDLQDSDWRIESARWADIRERFSAMKGVRLFVISDPNPIEGNMSVHVDKAVRVEKEGASSLELDFRVSRAQGEGALKLPLRLSLNGVASTVEFELEGEEIVIEGFQIAIDDSIASGWGSLELPGDSNAMDNSAYFTYAPTPNPRALVIAEDEEIGAAIRLSLAIPAEGDVANSVELVGLSEVSDIGMDDVALIVWQGFGPTEEIATRLRAHVEKGRSLILFPPLVAEGAELFGMRWGSWEEPVSIEESGLSWWRSDSDILANVADGAPLPLEDLRIYRYRSIAPLEGNVVETPLALISDGKPVIVRAPSAQGAVYFFGFSPVSNSSSLERDAIAFYVALQRALAMGNQAMDPNSSIVVGDVLPTGFAEFEHVSSQSVSSDYIRGLTAGVYKNGNRLVSLSRSPVEDSGVSFGEDRLDILLAGTRYQLVLDSFENEASLASEIWRLFLLVMAIALIVEAWLCLPEKVAESAGTVGVVGVGRK